MALGADRKLPQQAGWRKLLSPWLFVVAGAFLLGAYTCSSGALTQKGGRKTDAAALRRDKLAAAKKAKKPKRAVVEDEEEDVEEAAAPAASAVILANQAPAPPKPDGATRSVTFFDGNTVNVYPHVDQGSGNADWWGAVTAGWETDSLHAIKLFLQLKRKTQKHVVEVDFGCWVGPTVLFAGAYADKIYAMEPDPGAYREVYHNVKSNPAIAAKTQLQQLCISDKEGAITMYGSPGDSMSTLFSAESDRKKSGYTNWQVECTTLDKFSAKHDIKPAEIGIIKLDTEGAEGRILVQLKPWLIKHKPTILLSMHVFLYPEDAKLHEAVKEVLYSYKTLLLANGDVIDRNAFSVAGWCRLCTLILTEEELPAGFATWKEALAAQGKK